MTAQLPITISIKSELVDKFPKMPSIINKLEAQFNFHTLTANWYGDEEHILLIQLLLDIPAGFMKSQEELKFLATDTFQITHFSDDVMCKFNERAQQLFCHIALTDSELELLEKQSKLLTGFLQAKLHKVLNLIAKQQSLTSI